MSVHSSMQHIHVNNMAGAWQIWGVIGLGKTSDVLSFFLPKEGTLKWFVLHCSTLF